jgi:hypothetical protein
MEGKLLAPPSIAPWKNYKWRNRIDLAASVQTKSPEECLCLSGVRANLHGTDLS